MRFPTLRETSRYRDMTTVFGGYNHQISCQEGQFYDMKNMTSTYYPVLSPRKNRGIVKTFTNPQGILDKEDLWWVDDGVLYKNGEEVKLKGVYLSPTTSKSIAKMGAYIVIMPDKIWVNTNKKEFGCGYMDNSTMVTGVTMNVCEASGKIIEWHDADYYKDKKDIKDGSYQMSVGSNGKPSLKVYSASTGIWMTVASTYVQINAKGIGDGFDKEDGVKITAKSMPDSLGDIFVNKEDDGEYSTNTYLLDVSENSIVIPGIFKGDTTDFPDLTLFVERKVPDMSFITECNNRIWGCSTDGHEIYCCKLGDVKNWNLFRGNSMDSWAATIGSDGKFTGAITYLGYPIFFKEDCLIKISVSSTGGHQTKETRCRGVQKGSHASLTVLNEVLYYKSTTSVCAYNGSLPWSISDEMGDVNYFNAVGGAIGDKYYISMSDSDDGNSGWGLFVYDTKNGIWCKEDDTRAYAFCKHKSDLYFIDDKDKTMKSVGGTLLSDEPETTKEGRVDWFVESGPIGYSSPDNKYVGRITLRITLEFGTNVDFFLQYDSCGEWEHKFNMSGKGTRTFSIPIVPKRCDHFKYKIVGRGDCKIHSITKTIEEGSEG